MVIFLFLILSIVLKIGIQLSISFPQKMCCILTCLQCSPHLFALPAEHCHSQKWISHSAQVLFWVFQVADSSYELPQHVFVGPSKQHFRSLYFLQWKYLHTPKKESQFTAFSRQNSPLSEAFPLDSRNTWLFSLLSL